MHIENDTVFLTWLVGGAAGMLALCVVAQFYGPPLPLFPLTLPAWLVGWYLLCWGVDGVLGVALRKET